MKKRRDCTEVQSWRSSKRWLVLGGLHAAVVVLATALLVPSGVAHTAAPSDGALESAQVLKLVDENGVEIPAEGYRSYGLALRRGSGCVVSGQVLGMAGGDKSVDVLLLGDEDFADWRWNPVETARGGYLRSVRQLATTINVRLPGPGQYHLVISNPSPTTAKMVQAKVEVGCPGAQSAERRRGLAGAEREKLRTELTSALRDVAAYQEAFYSDRGEYTTDLAKVAGYKAPPRVRIVVREASGAGWFATAHVLGVPDLVCSKYVGTTRLAARGVREGELVCR